MNKLNTKCLPIHYDIQLATDFSDFTFAGKTIVQLDAKESIKSLSLNAADLTINSVKIQAKNDTFDASFKLDLEAEEVLLEFPKQITGSFNVTFDYEGKIQDNLKGLYQTHYKVGKEVHIGAVTQFETEDARRMFPSFDEPGMKATFDLQVITDDKFKLISNMPIISEEKLENKRIKVTFDKTPKMSTYLLFLGIAEFEEIEDKLKDITVKVITHPGLIKYGKGALEFGLKSLDYCQNYFGIPYPLPKMDLICTPSFAAGAMENWGAILFRENDLLTFPNSTTYVQANRIKVVIAHEITHQWFGNLVSPSIWKYIWLNESFAEFFGHNIVDHYLPEIGLWNNVVATQTYVALEHDGYMETVPIEILDQKRTSYNIKTIPIIYNKGGSILRMVEAYVGKDKFQEGLNLHLSNHAYDIASSDDLWNALEEASKKPVSQLMKSWVLQPGYPLVTVSREGKTKLKFSQQRFTFLGNDDQTLWMIPISILFFTTKGEITKQFLLKEKEDTFDAGLEFTAFKLNTEHTGFFRVNYPSSDLDTLGTLVKNDKLSILDSWNLENDLYALFRAGKCSLEYYLKFISNYSSEKLYISHRSISNHLIELLQLAEGKTKEKIIKKAIKFHEEILDTIKYEPVKSEPFYYAVIRNTLLLNASYFGSEKAIDFGMSKFAELKNDKQVPADILDAVLSIAARKTNDLEWFLERFNSAKNEAETVILGAVFGEFSDDVVIQKVLDEVVFNKIPSRNQTSLIDRLSNNPYAIGKMWKFFIANLDNIGKMHQSFQGRTINYIVTNLVDEETKVDMEKFFADYGKINEVAKITTEKSFEILEMKLNFKGFLNKT